MSNNYYTNDIQLMPGTKAKAEDVNVRFNRVVLGFEKLPTPHPSLPGFSGPVLVGPPTSLDHAVSARQVVGSKATYAVDTGAVNAFVVNMAIAPESYADGLTVSFKAANANTGASTINLNGLGIKSLTRSTGAPLVAKDIAAGDIVTVIYIGTKFVGITSFQGQFVATEAVVANDKAIVAADKATVANDKAIVAADKATVAADKGIVANDKAIVAADKATVANDKAIVAADKATVATDTSTCINQAGIATSQAGVATDKAVIATSAVSTIDATVLTLATNLITTQNIVAQHHAFA